MTYIITSRHFDANMCDCCPLSLRVARIELNLVPCINLAEPRKLGILTFDHKTAPSLTISDRSTLSQLTRNDRRRDRRFKLT